jgi:hypothetical protein
MTDALPLSIDGSWFDGVSLESHPARLFFEGDLARVEVAERTLEFPLSALRVSPRVFEAPRFVSFPDGGQLVCPEQPALSRLAAASVSEGPVAWLERRVGVAIAAVFLTLGGVALLYLYGLPRVAEAVAARVPRARERALGESVLDALDHHGKGSASWLEQATLEPVKHGFEALTRGLPAGTGARLEFRNERAMGPNAFALPGGIVVITDELVTLCPGDESVGVLAHELGHVRHRHPLRHLLQEFGVGALGALLGSDASSLSLSLSAVPVVVATAHYSQDLEREADAEGFALAAGAGYSPALFASCLEKLSAKRSTADFGALSYLSSHPPDADRMARARHAADEFARQHRASAQ